MDRLIVKNFGPLKDVDIKLNKINLFIGENGSGKSVLGKLVTIFMDIQLCEEENLLKKFSEYQIDFISEKSIIEFYPDGYVENEVFIKLRNKKIIFSKFHGKLKDLLDESTAQEKELNKLLEVLKAVPKEDIEKAPLSMDEKKSIFYFIKNGINKDKKREELKPQYIPAERNLISLFNKSLTTLLVAEVPLPKFLLAFSSEFEKAGNDLKELEFLNVKYVNGDGLDRHKVYFNDEDYLSLEHSSSGVQSSLPLYLTVTYLTQKHRNIIIEEPEQNLFPKAQKETIEYIIEQVSNSNNLFMMTHSPYVLSTLNTLMMAYRAGILNDNAKEEVLELFNENQWINPSDFSAYYLENGIARDIKGRTGLISDNEIDEISDEMAYGFEELLSIYREHKNDK
ncbi:MAG: Unknown protein [uncultured Sulfurovum sp.]|uniref:Endonuclease GajA/Old nuclease/RecF-like AAA domain-containing protein n=1 Tax=uncultured Sulfurovum sp. TaxID=269237 RepID=A0A6S6SYS2_9BACT|nr:MAG: Unknown protein [uncultured Sulfurovum sp.]